MNQLSIIILNLVVGYFLGIGTIVLSAHLINKKFGKDGAKKIIKK